MRRWTAVPVLVTMLLVAGACSSGSTPVAEAPDQPDEPAPSTDATSPGVTAPTTSPSEPSDVVDVTRVEGVVDEGSMPTAVDDASFPDGVAPATAIGTYGFSRYVWSLGDGGAVLATLVEGPRGQQVRCQDPDLPCSYLELADLAATADPVPESLGMDREELVTLVDELDRLAGVLTGYDHPDEVCAAGYQRTSSQNPNMGIHMVNSALIADGFVVEAPEILLLGMDGGERLTQSEVGECVDGAWTGDPAFGVVGAAYMLPMTPDHPDGFSGPIDNWHVHYNTCAGAEREDRSIASRSACEEEGGSFQEIVPVWMMHAYAHPDFDSDEGVFAMFNGSIWPVVDGAAIVAERTGTDPAGAVLASIDNFAFGSVTVGVGEEVVFANSDSVPHTVTAGTPAQPSGAFDSGLLGTGGTFGATFSTPGEYALFCALHPQMTGTVVVES